MAFFDPRRAAGFFGILAVYWLIAAGTLVSSAAKKLRAGPEADVVGPYMARFAGIRPALPARRMAVGYHSDAAALAPMGALAQQDALLAPYALTPNVPRFGEVGLPFSVVNFGAPATVVEFAQQHGLAVVWQNQLGVAVLKRR